MQGRKRDKVGQTSPDFFDGSATTPAKAVNAGHKTGKRKRGVSVTKRKPRQNTRVTSYNVTDASGNVVVRNVHTFTYKRPTSES